MKIEIEVEEDDFTSYPITSGMQRITHSLVHKKAHEAYEKAKNKIQLGEWFLLTHSNMVRKWSDFDDSGHSGAHVHCKKLSPELQEMLNKEIG